jgi:hypothetical protein
MKSERTKNALLAAGSLIICLAAGEAAAKLILPPPARLDRPTVFAVLHHPDPLLGWTLTRGPVRFPHRLVDDQGVVQYDVTYGVSGGTRLTSQWPHEGPALIAAGCSFTFGHGVNDQDSWPWLVQEGLAGYRVINAAVMGYGTDQALLAAERELEQNRGRTAAIVLGFGDFQIERNRGAQGWLVHVYPFSKPLFTVRAGAAEYVRQVHFWDPGAVAGQSDLFTHALNAFANRSYGVPSHEQSRELTVALLTTFAKRFQARGARFAVVTLPYLGDQWPNTRGDREFVVERLRAHHIPVLEPNFPRGENGGIEGRDFMVSRIDRHPNAHYYALLSGQILSFLRAEGIVAP